MWDQLVPRGRGTRRCKGRARVSRAQTSAGGPGPGLRLVAPRGALATPRERAAGAAEPEQPNGASGPAPPALRRLPRQDDRTLRQRPGCCTSPEEEGEARTPRGRSPAAALPEAVAAGKPHSPASPLCSRVFADCGVLTPPRVSRRARASFAGAAGGGGSFVRAGRPSAGRVRAAPAGRSSGGPGARSTHAGRLRAAPDLPPPCF